jgi:hypothetical protein
MVRSATSPSLHSFRGCSAHPLPRPRHGRPGTSESTLAPLMSSAFRPWAGCRPRGTR